MIFNIICFKNRHDEVNHESEYGEYGPLSYQQDDSLPDNEPYQQELEMDAMPCNVDNTITNHEAPDISSR